MFILDILVIVVLVLATVIYARKGLSGVMLDIIGFILSAILAWAIGSTIGSWLFESAIAKVLPDKLTEHYLSPKSIAGVLGFIVVFLVAVVVWKFLSKKLSKLVKFPVVGALNHILGALMGLLLGYLLVQVLVLVVFVPLQLFSFFADKPEAIMNSSTVARWFYQHNLLRALFGFN